MNCWRWSGKNAGYKKQEFRETLTLRSTKGLHQFEGRDKRGQGYIGGRFQNPVVVASEDNVTKLPSRPDHSDRLAIEDQADSACIASSNSSAFMTFDASLLFPFQCPAEFLSS